VVDCFGWWATETYTDPCTTLTKKIILDVVLEKFEMYHAYLRLINRKSKHGTKALTARGCSTGALVHRIRDDMFTPDDEKQFDIRWTP